MIEKTTQMNLLYDFYHGLLSEKQQQYMQLYYLDDLSLSEIAEHYDVSRQAVFEQIKRAEHMLIKCEETLQLLTKHQRRTEIIALLENLIQEKHWDIAKVKHLCQALKELD
jgi:predicted DNA-binding protein YlxM (UPF0122 family)